VALAYDVLSLSDFLLHEREDSVHEGETQGSTRKVDGHSGVLGGMEVRGSHLRGTAKREGK